VSTALLSTMDLTWKIMGTDEKDIFKGMHGWCPFSRFQGAVRNT